jgi:hypothetical protein
MCAFNIKNLQHAWPSLSTVNWVISAHFEKLKCVKFYSHWKSALIIGIYPTMMRNTCVDQDQEFLVWSHTQVFFFSLFSSLFSFFSLCDQRPLVWTRTTQDFLDNDSGMSHDWCYLMGFIVLLLFHYSFNNHILHPSQMIRKKKTHLLKKLKHKNLEYSFLCFLWK